MLKVMGGGYSFAARRQPSTDAPESNRQILYSTGPIDQNRPFSCLLEQQPRGWSHELAKSTSIGGRSSFQHEW